MTHAPDTSPLQAAVASYRSRALARRGTVIQAPPPPHASRPHAS